MVLSCGSVSFEYKQVVKTLLIFHRPPQRGWAGDEEKKMNFFNTFMHPSFRSVPFIFRIVLPCVTKGVCVQARSNPPATLYPSSK